MSLLNVLESAEKDSVVRKVLRLQAWERAKGELQSILRTYESDSPDYINARERITRFISNSEQNETFE